MSIKNGRVLDLIDHVVREAIAAQVEPRDFVIEVAACWRASKEDEVKDAASEFQKMLTRKVNAG